MNNDHPSQPPNGSRVQVYIMERLDEVFENLTKTRTELSELHRLVESHIETHRKIIRTVKWFATTAASALAGVIGLIITRLARGEF